MARVNGIRNTASVVFMSQIYLRKDKCRQRNLQEE